MRMVGVRLRLGQLCPSKIRTPGLRSAVEAPSLGGGSSSFLVTLCDKVWEGGCRKSSWPEAGESNPHCWARESLTAASEGGLLRHRKRDSGVQEQGSNLGARPWLIVEGELNLCSGCTEFGGWSQERKRGNAGWILLPCIEFEDSPETLNNLEYVKREDSRL